MNIRKRRTLSATILAAAAALAIGVAIAAVPGPTATGEFYYYHNASGALVGYRAIDCNGNKVGWGVTSARYSSGWMICNPPAD